MCTAMRTELALIREITPAWMDEADEAFHSMLAFRIGYNFEAANAALAEQLAPICAERELERIMPPTSRTSEVDPRRKAIRDLALRVRRPTTSGCADELRSGRARLRL